jgi:hypothetical protein
MPPRKTPVPPTALDRLDPAPGTPPPPKRTRRPRKGLVESAVAADLAALPENLRKCAIAASVLRLALELDTGVVMGRDAAGHAREIRLAMLTLRELAPAGEKGDQTDEVRERRERRLGQASGLAE